MSIAYIGIGSNLGNREDTCSGALKLLERNGVKVVRVSSLYETEPWGLKDQPSFLNLAAGVRTALSPAKLLRVLKKIELEMGRKNTLVWGPRIIDLDILLYDDLQITGNNLVIPHPFMHVREFVLRPLAEIAPDVMHPVLGITVKELLLKQEALSSGKVYRTPRIDYNRDQNLLEGFPVNKSPRLQNLLDGIKKRTASVGIIGLGYVGLPLVIEFIRAGFQVKGFDLDPGKISFLKKGASYIKHIPAEKISAMNRTKRFLPTTDFSKISETDCILICVPTPLNKYREPDMSYVFTTAETISRHLRKGHLIVLESTTYPGTTDEDMKPILERSGLRAGKDFFLAFSPEREDPNNLNFSTSTIPKVVGGYTPSCLKAAQALYDTIIVRTVPVSSTKVAEASKLLENIYRVVNIALVNELKMCFERMGINVWEVIEASKTKPFGFQAFYPGPGLGGHCIPIDPFYLTWKAREYDFHTKFIELAGDVNSGMPYYVAEKVMEALNAKGKSIKGAKVLILGLAYKKDIDDVRESPSLKLITLLREMRAKVAYSDPHVPKTKKMRDYDLNMTSVPLTEKNLGKYDCVLISTDHSAFDYRFIVKHSSLIVDARNATGKIRSSKIVRA